MENFETQPSASLKLFNQTDSYQKIQIFGNSFENGTGVIYKHDCKYENYKFNFLKIYYDNFTDLLTSLIILDGKSYPIIAFKDKYEPEYGYINITGFNLTQKNKLEFYLPSNASVNIILALDKTIIPNSQWDYPCFGVIVKNTDHKNSHSINLLSKNNPTTQTDISPLYLKKINCFENNFEVNRLNYAVCASKNYSQVSESIRDNSGQDIIHAYICPYQHYDSFGTNRFNQQDENNFWVDILPNTEVLYFFAGLGAESASKMPITGEKSTKPTDYVVSK